MRGRSRALTANPRGVEQTGYARCVERVNERKEHMKTLNRIWALVVVSALSCIGADELSSIRLTSSYDQHTQQITLSWSNAGHEAFLLLMGGFLGGQAQPLLKAELVRPAGSISLYYDGMLGRDQGSAFEGRADPWVVPLPPGCTFSIQVGAGGFVSRCMAINQQLGTDWAARGSWKLKVIWTGQQGYDYLAGTKIPYSITRNGPNQIPFAIGTLTTAVSSP